MEKSSRNKDIDEIINKWDEIKCVNMEWCKFKEDLVDWFDAIDKRNKNYLKWVTGIVAGVLLFVLGIVYNLNAASAKHITKDEVRDNYVTNQDLMVMIKFSNDFMLKIATLDKAGVNDSVIIDAYEQYDYTLSLIWGDTGSRGVFQDDEPYFKLLEHIRKNNE